MLLGLPVMGIDGSILNTTMLSGPELIYMQAYIHAYLFIGILYRQVMKCQSQKSTHKPSMKLSSLYNENTAHRGIQKGPYTDAQASCYHAGIFPGLTK